MKKLILILAVSLSVVTLSSFTNSSPKQFAEKKLKVDPPIPGAWLASSWTYTTPYYESVTFQLWETSNFQREIVIKVAVNGIPGYVSIINSGSVSMSGSGVLVSGPFELQYFGGTTGTIIIPDGYYTATTH